MKKVLIVSTSPRAHSNSEALANAFAEGARAAGHEAEVISLRDRTVNFCRGCFVCQEKLRCVIRDDADEICQKALQADVLVFATPIYYYEMSGQLKTLLDRLNPLFPSDYAFRDVYLLTAAAEDEEHVPQRAVSGLEAGSNALSGRALPEPSSWAASRPPGKTRSIPRWCRRTGWGTKSKPGKYLTVSRFPLVRRLKAENMTATASHPCGEALFSSAAKESIFRKPGIHGIIFLKLMPMRFISGYLIIPCARYCQEKRKGEQTHETVCC